LGNFYVILYCQFIITQNVAMKKTIVFLFLLGVMYLPARSQQVNPYPKTITVTGSAEIEVIPDEIYAQVDLKEYDKKGQGKVNIDKIKQDFLVTAKAVGIADSNVTINAYDGYNGNPWWRKKNKKEELYASITYLVKIKNSKQMDDLVNRLDDNATQNFSITRTSHSRIAEYRKQLKIAAVRAAKEKAQYLAEAINESVGPAVTIAEPVEYNYPMIYNRVSNMSMKAQAPAGGDDINQPDFTKIKLKYDVTVVFALK
jgi:uncharacterized protein